VIDSAPRRAGGLPLVALVRGDLGELETLRVAAQLAEAAGAPLTGCVLPLRPRSGLPLLRDLAGDRVEGWRGWSELAAELRARTAVRGLVVSSSTWRLAARGLWPALERCPVVVQRRRPGGLPGSVLMAVDSRTTNAAMARLLDALGVAAPRRITVVYASVPAWAASLASAMGYPALAGGPVEERFPWPLAAGANGVCVHSTPFWAIRCLAHELRPDMVVLGLHRHRVPVPALAHPTAWALSRELASDVLLYPV